MILDRYLVPTLLNEEGRIFKGAAIGNFKVTTHLFNLISRLELQPSMSTYLITGSTRGIGLVSHIFASGRRPSEGLAKLAQANPDRVHFVELEVTNASSINNAVKQVEQILSVHEATLDILINNAGIMNYTPNGVETMSDLGETLNINVTGTHLVTAAFLPLLREGKNKKLVNVSSVFGSLADSGKYVQFPTPAYKISKAAMNMLTRQYANDLAKDGFSVFCLSPGWVKTDLGSKYADLTIDESVTAVFDIVSSANTDSNGKFLQCISTLY
ncbi:dehydrogenase [Flagelloscypha sp. PMI_526]|nr:dehydrogenase [Flagelloscypha sp. PMI_526]